MATQRLFQSLGWPVATGLIIALLTLLVFPELRPRHTASQPPQSAQRSSVAASNGEGPVSYSEAVDRAAPAVVTISTQRVMERQPHPLADHPLYRHLFRNSDQPQQERMQSALGSGVIVDPRGYLLTNEHVIKDAQEILVMLYDGREIQAELVGTDPYSDLAVLKIELDQLTTIELGAPAKSRVGDVVLAIGNPFGVGQTVTQGIISATGRWNLNISEYENFLQTDAAINIGNSGGALVDAQGKLLGINTAIFGEGVGISFAIPADNAIESLTEIIEKGRVVRGWLGVDARPLTPELAEYLSLSTTDGVLVTAVVPNGPAHKAGLRPGDVLTHINDQPVGQGRRGMNQIAAIEPGSTAQLSVMRENQPVSLEAVIGERPTPRR